MRILPIILIAAILISSCKPKDKGPTLNDPLPKDSTKIETKEERKDSPRDVIIGKWIMKESSPGPTSEEEKTEMLNTVIEFTNAGKILVTSKGETKEEASFTLSTDNKYMLSVEADKTNIDSIFIEEATHDKLVLTAVKDKRRIVFTPAK